jgi:serine/threonine-protein kinase
VDPREPTTSFGSGEILSSKYQIVRVIGEGGMGIVYEGVHQRLGQRVAIKTLSPSHKSDREACLRFEREARAAAKLKSKYIAKVTDVDALPDGTPYMVMEYLDGRDLGAELAQRGRLPIAEAVGFVLQACAAMAEAHGRGIIHRDLKPENLFLCDDTVPRTVKVLDFGISKIVDQDEARMTTTGATLGTPLYMSPEQIRAVRTIDARSDIWSLAVIAYEAIAGQPPFEGGGATAVVAAITADEPVPLRKRCREVSQDLSDAVARALQKRPADRFADVTAFAAALRPFAPGLEVDWPSSARGNTTDPVYTLPPSHAREAVSGHDHTLRSDDRGLSAAASDTAPSSVARPDAATVRQDSSPHSREALRPRVFTEGPVSLGAAIAPRKRTLMIGLGLVAAITSGVLLVRSIASSNGSTHASTTPVSASTPEPSRAPNAASSAPDVPLPLARNSAAPAEASAIPKSSARAASSPASSPRARPSSEPTATAAPPPPPARSAKPTAPDGSPLTL